MSIALKEANETRYWIELLSRSQLVTEKQFDSIHIDIVELIKLLTSIINTAKRNPDHRKQNK
jgi:four helix bundle protein